jgi:hypothetical protein
VPTDSSDTPDIDCIWVVSSKVQNNSRQYPQNPLLLRVKEKERRSSIVYRYKRRKTLDLYTEKRPYSAKPSITTGARSRVPVPELGLFLSMGATSHRPDARSLRPMGAVSPRTPPKSPGQISCQQLHAASIRRKSPEMI